ncbi:hypothetical protein CANCADRAFT_106295 [Tortispora caseinolytica NRRL Y-17796]|uniref:Saccharopine dehydrogenase [NADP(+), L-glutamate-forming] n=1 Tax=Tortispora caseinolytica NRRL Y-17796 TaxID=767744 RepID=A0A1E4TF57_9ASCO|nr:hypothetical protein CANCADRAFT_106295 [Tortispora caseinolytica NRRL Y-17796]
MGYNVLLLGSGFVAKPAVEVLVDAGIHVTIACRTLAKARELASGFKGVDAVAIDAQDPKALDAEVSKNDLVISLIPYIHHPTVIESAIRCKKHVVTTSYISPAIRALEPKVKEAGITVMNEIGLDPGIDHLYAVKTISEVHAAGGKIKGFLSYCGGLPAPEASNNPLGYKFSWSSRGVLLALRNSAKYYENGKLVEVDGKDLMGTAKRYHSGYLGYNFVCYPNRDSTPFKEWYHIPEADTVVRGTLRYDGFPEFVAALVDLGFLDDSDKDYVSSSKPGLPWNQVLAKALGAKSTSTEDLEWAISSKTKFANNQVKQRVLAGMKWLGMFSETAVTPRDNLLDTLCATLEEKMQFEGDERDLVFLQHMFKIENKDGSEETRSSTLVEYGIPGGYSAMARTVGIPCAVAVQMVLKGTIKGPGVLGPYSPEINEPLMAELKSKYGIYCREKTLD